MVFPERDSQSTISSPWQGIGRVLVSVYAFILKYYMPNKMLVKEEDHEMKIRQAGIGDNLLLSKLSVEVQRLHAENHPDIFKMPASDDFAGDFFREMLADPLVTIFIAEDDTGQALGCALCKLVERPDGPFTFAARYLLIDQLSVLPGAQGRGVGTALVERAVELAGEMEIKRVQLDSWAFNTKAHTFFERTGFEKFTHRFWRFD